MVRAWLVLDAGTGQSAICHAQRFHETLTLDGLILSKIDGSARGGVIFPLLMQLKLPVLYLGTGEQLDDLESFDASRFVEALLAPTAP